MKLRNSVAIIVLAACVHQAQVAPTIDAALFASLKEKPVNIVVSLKQSTVPTLSSLKSNLQFSTRTDRINAVVQALREFTQESQRPVLELLTREQVNKGFRFEPLWITNKVVVWDADLETVLKLSELDQVSKIQEDFALPLEPFRDFHEFTSDELESIDEGDVQWGVAQIEAPEVWQGGNRGEGIIVANVDSGVRLTHEALVNGYVGEYGWFDPFGKTELPADSTGHGTHTMATILGSVRNVGVAPGARWAACKGCIAAFCFSIDLLKCGQWAACPTLPDGTAEDCSKAPQIVSNSWGGGQGNDWYLEVIEAQKVAGIIPLFSQGNSGPECGTANSPGDYEELIGVGATTIDNQLSNYSSVGPTLVGGRIKPDVAAPGSNVFSAYHTSDTAYATMSGTSMACPHAAGAVALILKENTNLGYEQVKAFLQQGSVPTLSTGASCGGIGEDVYPNHHVGSGRINVANSVYAVRKLWNR